MTFDAAGRLLTQVDPRGHAGGADPALFRTTYVHDDADHLTSVTDALGHVTSAAFDAAGNLESVTDANNHATTYAYDAANHLTSVTDAAEQDDVVRRTTTVAMSRHGPIRTTHVTSWTYDLANRVTTETDPLGPRPDDRLRRRQATRRPGSTPMARRRPSRYDALNRLSSITYALPSTPAVGFTYDANGNRTSMTDGAGTESYQFDALDRLIGVTRGADSFAYTYDAAGNVLTRQYPGGPTTTYTYDDDGRMASASTPGARCGPGRHRRPIGPDRSRPPPRSAAPGSISPGPPRPTTSGSRATRSGATVRYVRPRSVTVGSVSHQRHRARRQHDLHLQGQRDRRGRQGIGPVGCGRGHHATSPATPSRRSCPSGVSRDRLRAGTA